MSMPTQPSMARPATLERAPCPDRFQARWASVWASTCWQGEAYEGHAPLFKEDAHQRKHREALYATLERWHAPAALAQLQALLETGGMVHTPNAPSSPWGRLLNVIPPPDSDDRILWERLAHLMLQHGASINEVAYPWLLGDPRPPVYSIEDPPEVVKPSRPLGTWMSMNKPLLPGLVVITGSTGSGKSTMLGGILKQMLQHPCSTPLAQAASSGNVTLARWLMQEGADPLRASPWVSPSSDRSASPSTPTEACWALPFMIAEWNDHPALADELEAPALALAENQHLREAREDPWTTDGPLAPTVRRRL